MLLLFTGQGRRLGVMPSPEELEAVGVRTSAAQQASLNAGRPSSSTFGLPPVIPTATPPATQAVVLSPAFAPFPAKL